MNHREAYKIGVVDGNGRDPRKMTREELSEMGHESRPLLAVIRAKCLDCCNQMLNEVLNCPSVACDLWPYRMNKNTTRQARDLTEEQRNAMATRLSAARQKNVDVDDE